MDGITHYNWSRFSIEEQLKKDRFLFPQHDAVMVALPVQNIFSVWTKTHLSAVLPQNYDILIYS